MTVTTATTTAIIDGQRLFPSPGTAFHPAVKSKGIMTAGMPFTPYRRPDTYSAFVAKRSLERSFENNRAAASQFVADP
jgi:hypothetical protein